jgi:hypothetical protein
LERRETPSTRAHLSHAPLPFFFRLAK